MSWRVFDALLRVLLLLTTTTAQASAILCGYVVTLTPKLGNQFRLGFDFLGSAGRAEFIENAGPRHEPLFIFIIIRHRWRMNESSSHIHVVLSSCCCCC